MQHYDYSDCCAGDEPQTLGRGDLVNVVSDWVWSVAFHRSMAAAAETATRPSLWPVTAVARKLPYATFMMLGWAVLIGVFGNVSSLLPSHGGTDPYPSTGLLQRCPTLRAVFSRFASTKQSLVATGSRPGVAVGE